MAGAVRGRNIDEIKTKLTLKALYIQILIGSTDMKFTDRKYVLIRKLSYGALFVAFSIRVFENCLGSLIVYGFLMSCISYMETI